jgi:hypothetical protein
MHEKHGGEVRTNRVNSARVQSLRLVTADNEQQKLRLTTKKSMAKAKSLGEGEPVLSITIV